MVVVQTVFLPRPPVAGGAVIDETAVYVRADSNPIGETRDRSSGGSGNDQISGVNLAHPRWNELSYRRHIPSEGHLHFIPNGSVRA